MNALVRAPLDGDILGPADVITVTAAVHPLKPKAEILILPAGLSLTEIVAEVGRLCHVSRLARGADVSISGHVVDPALWSKVRVKAGAHVSVRARAGKAVGNILKSVLMIALSVAAAWIVGPAGLGIAAAIGGTAGQVVASLAAGAIMMAGSIALNALFPPTQTKAQENNPSYSISAGRNGVSKWGPIPVVLGKVRALPKYAALPYTEFEGDDQYLRMLFVWGYGPMKIEDIRIGDTSIDEFDDVEIETFEGYADDGQQTIYPSEVVQDDLSIEPEQNKPIVRTSADDADEIILDFVAPSGICKMTGEGDRERYTVEFKVEFSPAGAGAWVDKGNVTLAGKTNNVRRRSYRYPVTKGQYDVRITRLTKDSKSTKIFDSVSWTAIKSFRTGNPPISFGRPLAITALRIRASKQLNGAVDTLNALVTSIGKSWDGSSWVEAQETRNPADLMRLVLQGPANARAVADSRVDLSTLAAFADHCTAKGYAFDMYRDFTASVKDTLRDIAAAGRAVPTFKDGKWSVTWEQDDALVIQHFTPRNSRDFRWNQTYRVLPHGLRCKFVNAAKDYIEDELLCFAEGYNKDNASLYETAEFPGVTSAEIVYKHGLYRLADATDRPAVYTFTVDFEHLVAQRGDRVAMAYDVIEQGIASGRIKTVDGLQLTLDEPAVMEAGKLYGIRVRRKDGTSIVRQVTTVAGEQSVITITGTAPEAGDLYSFGIRGQETGIYRILRIRPGSDLSAEIDLVDDGPNVQAGDSETDIPSGTVTPPALISSFTPFGLRSESFVKPGQTGSTYAVRIYWQQVLGPDYLSFEIVGISDDGTVTQVVGGAEQSAEFGEMPSGLWSFTVRGLMADGRYTLASTPLAVPIDVPHSDLGVGLSDTQTDVYATLQRLRSDLNDTVARMEMIAAGSADIGSGIPTQDIKRVEFERGTARVFEGYDAWIVQTNGVLVSYAGRIEGAESAIDDLEAGKLDASVISGYYTKTETDGVASSAAAAAALALSSTLSPQIAAAQSAADDAATLAATKLDASAINNYYTKTQTDGVASVAAASAASSVKATMEGPGGSVAAAQDDAGTALAALSGFTTSGAVAAAFSAQDASITAVGNTVSSLASTVSGVEAKVNGVSASGLLRASAQATSTGAQSTVGLIAEASAGEETHTAGLLLDALSNGKSRVVALGDQFVIADPTDPDNIKKLVVFEDGKAYLDEIAVRKIVADEIQVIGKFDAAQILLDGSAITDVLAPSAVTAYAGDYQEKTWADGAPIPSGWNTLASITCENPNPTAPTILYEMGGTVQLGGGGGSKSLRFRMRLARVVGGVAQDVGIIVFDQSATSTGGTSISWTHQIGITPIIETEAPQGTYTYEVQYNISGTNVGAMRPGSNIYGRIQATWGKR